MRNKYQLDQGPRTISSAANCHKVGNINQWKICEAVNCSSKASVQIQVKAGQLGSISLSLCNDCVSKFKDE